MRTEVHAALTGRVLNFLLTGSTLMASLAVMVGHARGDWNADTAALRRMARETVASAAVRPGTKVGTKINTTGCVLHLPGGSGSYPAFWIRDAAMMLGGDLIPVSEIEGWIRLIAATQAGRQGISLQHGLFVPAFSIPDHINVNGKAVWFPGTYADGDDQGDGQYGHLPPADDAFFFVQMVREHFNLTGKPALLGMRVPTGDGIHSVMEICDRAFESVAVDPTTGIVVCDETPGRTRVDWGFCDSVHKSGLALVPTILRFRAAGDLAILHDAVGEHAVAAAYRQTAARLREAVTKTFLHKIPGDEAMLLSATGLGRKFDVWGSALAVTEGMLAGEEETAVCRGLLSLYQTGGIVAEGQVRAMPLSGPLGGYWEKSASPPGQYQNGAYWGTMSGWLIVALHKVDPPAARAILHELVASVARDRQGGAPWEWINPGLGLYRNPRYCATVALPYVTLRRCGLVEAEP